MPNSEIFQPHLLDGKVALVTGGGTGIGVEIARELARQGATVVIASRKTENIERAAAGLTEQLGVPVYATTCDIRDREGVSACVAGVLEKHDKIDILINNGGGQFFSPAEAISPRGWDAVVSTNLTGTWNMTRAVADQWMLAQGGRVVSITMLTNRTFPGMSHSVAARAGVEAFTRTASVEWAARGIRMNCVAPGYIASSGLKRYPPELGIIQQMRSHVPLKRLGTCSEVAWLVAFLVGPAGDYITGQTFTLDGGKELWGDYWPIPDPDDMPPIEFPVEPWETEDD